jgi:hypothetical protein
MVREQENQPTPSALGSDVEATTFQRVHVLWISPEKIGGDDLEPAGLMRSQWGKARVGEGPPFPTRLKGLTGADFPKMVCKILRTQE